MHFDCKKRDNRRTAVNFGIIEVDIGQALGPRISVRGGGGGWGKGKFSIKWG